MQEMTQINNEPADLQQELAKKSSEAEKLSNKLAELKKEQNHFTYIVSHDLQAPLRLVTGFLEILERKYADKLDQAAKQYIDFAVKGAVKMKGLITDLVEYSRLDAVADDFDEVDLNTIVQETLGVFSQVIEETGALVTIDQLPVIKASRVQMGKLFQHLFGNALKYRGTAVPEVKINARLENDFWLIGIHDNGLGIEEAYFEKIFIVFRKLHNDEAKYPGTGIGLAVCKKIVEQHGGSIRVESEPGKGSTFYFTVPATPVEG